MNQVIKIKKKSAPVTDIDLGYILPLGDFIEAEGVGEDTEIYGTRKDVVNREGLYVLTINLRSITQITAVSISDGEVLL